MRQQHLVNLEALAREQLLRHDWDALSATLAALLSAQVLCSRARLHSRLVMWMALPRRVFNRVLPHRACMEPVKGRGIEGLIKFDGPKCRTRN